MSLHVKLFTNFWTHRKTAKLRALLGNDAFWIPPRLWSYAAENQPDGDFSSYSAQELAMLIGYLGDATSMLQALQQACFMHEMKIHDWHEHNSYHHEYSERAKKAAAARWGKTKKKGKDKIGEDRIGDKQCIKHTSSISPSNPSLTSNQNAAKEVLDYLNEKTGSALPHDVSLLKSISFQINKNHSVSDLKLVIDFKVKEWGKKPDFAKNLVPSILFKDGKFLEYLSGAKMSGNSQKVVLRPSYSDLQDQGIVR